MAQQTTERFRGLSLRHPFGLPSASAALPVGHQTWDIFFLLAPTSQAVPVRAQYCARSTARSGKSAPRHAAQGCFQPIEHPESCSAGARPGCAAEPIIGVIWGLVNRANEVQRTSLLFMPRDSIAAGVDAEFGRYIALAEALSRSAGAARRQSQCVRGRGAKQRSQPRVEPGSWSRLDRWPAAGRHHHRAAAGWPRRQSDRDRRMDRSAGSEHVR